MFSSTVSFSQLSPAACRHSSQKQAVYSGKQMSDRGMAQLYLLLPCPHVGATSVLWGARQKEKGWMGPSQSFSHTADIHLPLQWIGWSVF